MTGLRTVAVFGATGGIGAAVVARLRADSIAVRALTRDASKLQAEPGLTVVAGDIADPEAVERTVAGADAVIWAAGATRNAADQVGLFETGARNLVAAMERNGVTRLVGLSGAGITLVGERKPFGGRLISAVVGLLVRHVVAAKQREYEVFRSSTLDWTLVRPPRVVPGGATGRVVIADRLRSRSVTQGDLGVALVGLAGNREHLRAAPYVSSR